jgi:hypothetical protein
MTPRSGVRVRQPKELALHCLEGLLLSRRQHTAEFVGDRESGTWVRRTVAADRARLPSHGLVLPIGHKGLLNRRKTRLECFFGSAGHGLSTPGAWSDIVVAWQMHLRHAGVGREVGYTLNLDKV